MKRRNAECGKLRRPIKRNKITEGIYGSTFLYLKFLLVWSLVLMADFIVEFRFEYLWPFWLLLRSVYDSFKYQGLAFSVFFVCIAITSDVVCYLFIPVQWLFFAASTYVWVQYVWHTDRGICLPTVSLWLLFVYVEASIRLRDFKSPAIYMDLGRPFAAHCIGYPVVTLGFGFKSYVSYRLRLRKQKEVEKENDFYIQLLQQALPPELQTTTQNDKHKALPSRSSSHEETISNGNITANSTSVSSASPTQTASSTSTPVTTTTTTSGGGTTHSKKPSVTVSAKQLNTETDFSAAINTCSTTAATSHKDLKKQNNMTGAPTGGGTPHIEDLIEHSLSTGKKSGGSVNTYDEENITNDSHVSKTYNKTTSVGSATKSSDAKLNKQNASMTSAGVKRGGKTTNSASSFPNIRDESYIRLEADMKRVKSDLMSCRNSEQELRSQISSQLVEEKATKVELYQLRDNNESLQTRLHNLVTSRQQDKQTITALERKLTEERKSRTQYEQQLATMEKKKKEEAAAASIRAAAASNTNREECSASCKARRREIETELKQKRMELMLYEDQIRQQERENKSLMQYKDAHTDTEVLMSALAAMQEKTAHLETSLSAETRLKLDLFSALGDAKRQIEIQQGLLMQKDAQIAEFKSKIAEVMAVMPASSSPFSAPSPSVSTEACAPHFSAGFTTHTPPHHHSPSPRLNMVCPVTPPPGEELLVKSSLNPNASDYTPKMSQ